MPSPGGETKAQGFVDPFGDASSHIIFSGQKNTDHEDEDEDEEKLLANQINSRRVTISDAEKNGVMINLHETIASVTLFFSLIAMPAMAGIIASISLGLPMVGAVFIGIVTAIASLVLGAHTRSASKGALLCDQYHNESMIKKQSLNKLLAKLETKLKDLQSSSENEKNPSVQKQSSTQADEQDKEMPKLTFFEKKISALNPRKPKIIFYLGLLAPIATSVIVGTLASVGIGGAVTSLVLPASIIGVCLFTMVTLLIIGNSLDRKYSEPEIAAQKTIVDLQEKIKETKKKIEETEKNNNEKPKAKKTEEAKATEEAIIEQQSESVTKDNAPQGNDPNVMTTLKDVKTNQKDTKGKDTLQSGKA